MPLAVILAGGLGTRLRDVVADVPKPMAPVAGRPFLEYQLDYWIRAGISEFVLSVGYRFETIMRHFGRSYRNARLDYAVEPSPLGTGGGLLNAVDQAGIDGPFLLLNGDTYFEADWRELQRCAVAQQADCCFSMFRSREANRYMQLRVSADGRIESLASSKATVGELANGGVYWLHPAMLKGIKEAGPTGLSFEDDVLPAALRKGARLCGVEFSGIFIDIGLPADYYRAASMLAGQGHHHKNLL